MKVIIYYNVIKNENKKKLIYLSFWV
jgi:hypothetical protein